MTHCHARERATRRQGGLTLVELMVSLLIGLFLLGGLLVMLQYNRHTFAGQKLLAQLQDNERLAMTTMTDVIQQAGYFPDPTIYTAVTALPAATVGTVSFAAGQALTGLYQSAAPGDTISARYTTASGDGILNCVGTANTSGANATYTSTFSVKQIGAVPTLVCTMNGTDYPLVSGVQTMNVLYGVANNAGSGTNVDTYMTATQVTAATKWGSVISMLVTLTFTNPLTGPGQPATIQVQRYISVMGAT